MAAVLVWEPRRVVPAYAVPRSALVADLVATDGPTPSSERPILDPRVPFAVHTAPGRASSVRLDDATVLDRAAFQIDEAGLEDLVVLDFAAFDWSEEDEPIVSHPRNPYHRIDVRASSRRVTVSHGGEVLAESTGALFLFEGDFPFVRYYLPRADVRAELVRDEQVTVCAYKGAATHWSVPALGLDAIAWTYEEPLEDAARIRDLVAFYTERLDLAIDGVAQERPWTPWSEPG